MSNSASSPAPAPAAPATGLRAPGLVHRLPNGLTLIVRENHEVAVATADVWVGTGSAHETPAIGGISHFLEHMMFKGTDRFGLGQIEREIEFHGGVSNAGTSYDFTHYYVTLPSAGVERAIQMLSEMVGFSSLDPAELEKERLVILEEYRRKQDNPEAMLFEDLYEQLYVAGPYHRAVIGSDATIRAITREQMADYYRRHYAPPNMTLVVTGDVRSSTVLDWAERHFGRLERPFDPLLPAGPEPSRTSAAKRFHRTKPTGGEVYLCLACAAPGLESPEDLIPLDIAETILGRGRASVLYQSVKERQRLASTITTAYWTMRYGATFMLDATCLPEKRTALRSALDAELEKFAAAPVADEQFRRATRLLASGHLFSFETTGGASSQIGYHQTLLGDTDLLDHYLERLAAVTPQDVRAAFGRLMDRARWVEVSVGPEATSAGALADGSDLEAATSTPPATHAPPEEREA